MNEFDLLVEVDELLYELYEIDMGFKERPIGLHEKIMTLGSQVRDYINSKQTKAWEGDE